MRLTDLQETVNHDVFNPAFNDTQFFDGLTYRASSEEDHQGKPYFVIKVFDDNFERVGLVKFALYKDDKGGEWLESLISAIHPKYQGKGIASHIYAYARMLGNTIKPSSDQTAQGRAMWTGWEKSGAAKHLTSNESKFTDYERAVMEGGHSLDKQRKSALREAISVKEAFDQPYKLKWEKGDHGDVDAIAQLNDGTYLSIMFNEEYSDWGDEEIHVEFHRNNSQEVTGEGDAQRVFATVLTAIQQYIKKYKPANLTFSASKEVEPGQNSQSRAKLYDRMVQRYANAWGYNTSHTDRGDKVEYELTRLQQGVTEDDLEEGWKDWVAGAALGAAALSPQAADAKVNPQQKPAITQQVQGDANYATKLILKPEAKILIQTARAAGMRGKELAQFVAQCAHETANFSSLKELGGRLDFKKYDPKFNPRKAKMLGNKQVGDGARYHGRGYIQLTGRDNYKRAGQALGLPLEEQPELVERPDVAAKVAVWFWQNQVAPKVSNFNDTAQVTKPINSGLKGLEDRHNKFASIMALMGSKS